MAGIYIHIPFCKQACYYCDFHFSTSLQRKPQMVNAICKELTLRSGEISAPLETVYFGGGTPSLLSATELNTIFEVIAQHYEIREEAEITLEANPDDLTPEKIRQLAASKVNRLSIGIQSFYEKDLVWMNRSHTCRQAEEAVRRAQKYFDNISIDLIYGVPGMSDQAWKENLRKTLSFGLPHVSSYALTVEPHTALSGMIRLGKKQAVDDAAAKRQYEILVETLTGAGYVNYEFSNFGLPGYFSRNNTAYWMGEPYIGIGPSAHGFDGEHRYWNIRHNLKYTEAIDSGILPSEWETLTLTDRYNEHIMTRLRTMWGVELKEIKQQFGETLLKYFEREAQPLIASGLLTEEKGVVHISPKGKFLGDRISADLFWVENP